MNTRLLPIVLLFILLTACSQPVQPGSGLSPTGLQPDAAAVSPGPVGGAMVTPVNLATRSIGTPVPGWENIPIMPGAYAPELEDMVYLYSVDSPVDQVEGFYQAKLEVNGWKMINRQTMQADASSGPSTILDYQKNDQALNVMLVSLPGGTSTTVILSVLGP